MEGFCDIVDIICINVSMSSHKYFTAKKIKLHFIHSMHCLANPYNNIPIITILLQST